MPDQTPSIEEIRARRAAITPGPWSADTRELWDMVVWGAPGTDPQPDDPENPRLVMNIGEPVVPVGDVCGSAADCQFIAHAPSDIDTLLSRVEADERRIKELEARVKELEAGQ